MKEFMDYEFDIQKILLACYVPANTGNLIHKNRPSHGLVLVAGGEADYIFDTGKTLTFFTGILYLPKGSGYQVQPRDGYCCFAINFDLVEDITFAPFLTKTKNTQEFLQRFQSAEKLWQRKPRGFQLKCKSELYSILYQLQQEHELGYLSGSNAEVIKPALDAIHRDYTSDTISIADLAERCGISEVYFRKIFLKHCGTSPVKYINNLKIARAKELIASGMYSVSQAAELSGFRDESYFSRTFKKAVGVCPSEYK